MSVLLHPERVQVSVSMAYRNNGKDLLQQEVRYQISFDSERDLHLIRSAELDEYRIQPRRSIVQRRVQMQDGWRTKRSTDNVVDESGKKRH